MKRKIVLFLILAIAVLFFIFVKWQESTHVRVLAGTESFEVFNGAPPLLNIAFEYPKSWKIFVSRARGAEEATVQLIGPRDLSHQFSASFAVIGKKKKEGLSLENEAENLIGRNKALNQFKVVSKEKIRVAGQDAQRVTFDFVINLPVGFPNAPPVPMREEVILVSQANGLYQVHFVGTLEQHRENNRLFQDFLKSFRFKE